MTAAVADFGLASVVAAPAPAAALVSAFVLVSAVVAEPVAAVVFAAAEHAVAVVSGLALIFFERALVAVAAFVLAAFHADRVFVLFALPAVLAAHRPLC